MLQKHTTEMENIINGVCQYKPPEMSMIYIEIAQAKDLLSHLSVYLSSDLKNKTLRNMQKKIIPFLLFPVHKDSPGCSECSRICPILVSWH